MDVILLERIERLGQMGDVVSVKPGYARNYLLPQKKALRATKENRSVFETKRAQLEAENLERRGDAEDVSEKMDGVRVMIIRAAGETGQLYGSVSARDVSNALTEDGFTVDRSQIAIARPIKTLGLFDVGVRLHPEVSVTVSVNVARSEEEAALQAERGGMITAEILEAEELAAERAAAEEAAQALVADMFEDPEQAEEAAESADGEEAAPAEEEAK
ncbi:MAG: 50S ribosomal protein L9 [Pseudomonadota bacterium]